MRERLSLVAAALFVGGVASIGAATPAYACHELTTGEDPIYNFACDTIHAVPEPGPTVEHYYNTVWALADWVYCTASPNC